MCFNCEASDILEDLIILQKTTTANYLVMKSNEIINPDKSGNSTSDLKKLYSSHVQEHFTLQKQIHDLDNAKVKKIRELNTNENLFLKKYEKYARSARLGRRLSVDSGIARVLEANNTANSRPHSRANEQSWDKSFVRDAISSDCPYSLGTWNRLVDSEKSSLEENKRDILFGEEKVNESDKEIENSDLEDIPEMQKLANKLEASGKRLEKRQTLEPITAQSFTFDQEAVDCEIREIQSKQKARGRRHSIAISAVSRGASNNIGSVFHLPSIGESGRTSPGRQISLSNPECDKQLETPVEKIEKKQMTSPERKILKNSRKLSLAETRSKSVHIQESRGRTEFQIPEIQVVSEDGVTTTEGNVGELDLILQAKRPIPTAAIFVQGESNESKTAQTNTDTLSEVISPRNSLQLPKLPNIPKASQNLVKQSDTESSQCKHVSFDDEPARDRSNSDASNLTEIGSGSPYGVRGRRSSMKVANLKLLVDSHHGAAKLRYIAKLANEMEKEEMAKHPVEPEPDIYKELSRCRYLRKAPREESTLSDDSRC